MAYASPKVELIKDNIIKIYHPEIGEPMTYLTATLAAAGTTATIRNTEGFANHDVLLLEGFNIESAEIQEANGVVSAGNSMTITATTFEHGIDCPIYKLLADQVQISGCDIIGDTKVVIEAVAIQSSGEHTEYVVAGTTYNYYFVRWYNSFASTPYYSAYSDALPATDFTTKMVGWIRRNAFANIGEEFDERFTANWVYDQIYLGELDVMKRLKRWSWLNVFDSDLGNLTEGQIKIALPDDIEDSKTNKSILGVRIENEINLDYMDWTEYQEKMQGVVNTIISTAVSVADTTFVLTNTEDLPDAGIIKVKTTLADTVFSQSGTDDVKGTYTAHGLSTGDKITVSGCTNSYCNREWIITNVSANIFTLDDASWTKFTGVDVTGDVVPLESSDIYYTGNDRVNNTLTGITATIYSIPAGTNIWYNISYGVPRRFTVNDGYIYFDIPLSNDYEGRNVWLDYYKKITKMDSDTDEISVNDEQLIISWLEMSIKKFKNNGKLATSDISLLEYNRRKKLLANNEISGQNLNLVPDISHLDPI